jgi:hypothetical protein
MSNNPGTVAALARRAQGQTALDAMARFFTAPRAETRSLTRVFQWSPARARMVV